MIRNLKFSLFSILYLVFILKADLYCAVSNDAEYKVPTSSGCGSSCCEEEEDLTCTASCCEVSHSHAPQSLGSTSKFQFSADKKVKSLARHIESNFFCRDFLTVETTLNFPISYRDFIGKSSYLPLYCIWRC